MTRQVPKDELMLFHDALMPVLSRAAIGNFDTDIEIHPGTSSRVTELLIGVQILLEMIREKVEDLEAANDRLQDSLDRSVHLLDEVLKRSLE